MRPYPDRGAGFLVLALARSFCTSTALGRTPSRPGVHVEAGSDANVLLAIEECLRHPGLVCEATKYSTPRRSGFSSPPNRRVSKHETAGRGRGHIEAVMAYAKAATSVLAITWPNIAARFSHCLPNTSRNETAEAFLGPCNTSATRRRATFRPPVAAARLCPARRRLPLLCPSGRIP